jgi:hypothetical protein
MCYPLNQTVVGATGTIPLDIRIQLHNVTGTAKQVRIIPYNNGITQKITLNNWTCTAADCERWIHVDFPLANVTKEGWTEFGAWVDMDMPNGATGTGARLWYNLNRWWVYFDNGKELRTGVPNPPVVGGGSWLPETVTGGSNYATSQIAMAQFPWNPTTGAMIPKSGTWNPVVNFQVSAGSDLRRGKAMIDPNLHGTPPSEGTVIYNGTAGTKTLSINTTLLSDGLHKLVLVGITDHSTGVEQSGVQVVPFLVDN